MRGTPVANCCWVIAYTHLPWNADASNMRTGLKQFKKNWFSSQNRWMDGRRTVGQTDGSLRQHSVLSSWFFLATLIENFCLPLCDVTSWFNVFLFWVQCMHHCSTLVEKLLFINPSILASHARRVSQPCSDGDSSRCCWFMTTTIVADGVRGSKSF